MARMRKKSTFSARDERFAAKLEMPTEDLLPPIKPREEAFEEPDPVPTLPADDEPAGVVPATPKPKRSRPSAPASNKSSRPSEISRGANREADGQEKERPVEVRLAFNWSADLTQRASVWAEKARCSAGAILTKAWDAHRKTIIETLEQGVRHTDIPNENISAAGARLSFRILLTAEAHGRLTAELDPEGIKGISSPLSRWVRQEVSPKVSDYLGSAGY